MRPQNRSFNFAENERVLYVVTPTKKIYNFLAFFLEFWRTYLNATYWSTVMLYGAHP